MRFFRSFNLLHRRTRSDPILITNRNDDCVFSTPERAVSTVIPLDDSGLGQNQPLGRTIPEVWYTATAFNEELATLRAEKQDLLSTNLALTHYNSQLRGEVARAREKVAELDAKETVNAIERSELAQKLREQEREIKKMRRRIGQDDKFIKLMTDIGLDDPVFVNAQAMLDAGEDINEMVVEAIKKAAMNPSSAWHSLVPAIAGQRAPQNYISAINLTLEARKELRRVKKTIKFWKDLALEVDANKGTITPSSSNLKEIRELLTPDRQAALDDLLGKLKKDNYPRLISELGYSSITDMAQEEALLSENTATQTTPMKANPNQGLPWTSPWRPKLQPLASTSFKEELALAIPSPRRPRTHKRSPMKLPSLSSKRSTLGEVDQNRASIECHPSASLPSMSSFKNPISKTFAKTRISAGYTTPFHQHRATFSDEDPVIPVSVTSDSFANAIFASLVQLDDEPIAPKSALLNLGGPESGRSTPFDNSAFEECCSDNRVSYTTASSYSVSSSSVAVSHIRSTDLTEVGNWAPPLGAKFLHEIKEAESEADTPSRARSSGTATYTRSSSVDRSWSLCEDKRIETELTSTCSTATPTKRLSLSKEKDKACEDLLGPSSELENAQPLPQAKLGSPNSCPTKRPRANSKLPVLKHIRKLSNSLIHNGKPKPVSRDAVDAKQYSTDIKPKGGGRTTKIGTMGVNRMVSKAGSKDTEARKLQGGRVASQKQEGKAKGRQKGQPTYK